MKDRKEVEPDGRGGGVEGVEGEENHNWNILCEKKILNKWEKEEEQVEACINSSGTHFELINIVIFVYIVISA